MAFSRRFLVFVATIGFCLILPSAIVANELEKKPNILIISLDDMNDWIGPMGGHPQAQTPHLDSFAQSAVTFRRAYTVSPSCNPFPHGHVQRQSPMGYRIV